MLVFPEGEWDRVFLGHGASVQLSSVEAFHFHMGLFSADVPGSGCPAGLPTCLSPAQEWSHVITAL